MYHTKYKCPCCNQETEKDPRPSYSDRYHKSGNHPLLQEYNKLLDESNQKLQELEQKIQEARKLEKMPSAKYGNTVVKVVEEKESWTDNKSPKIEGVRLTKYLLNKNERDAWMERWGNIMGGWDEKQDSVFYFRNPEGILTSTHGGWSGMLKTPTLITDEEWSQLKAGNIQRRLVE